MERLKLPEFEHKKTTDQIFCLVRKKWVALTPEEWVRQHFLNVLFTHLGYPRGLTRLEHHMTYFRNQKRSDILVFDKDGVVQLLVECKAPSVKLGQVVLNQVAQYNKVLDAQHLAITNGLKHYIWEKVNGQFHQTQAFPRYNR